jgi:membrane protein
MKEQALRAWAYVLRIYDAYNRHFSALLAAAVAFFIVLSAVPLFSIGISLVGVFVGGSEEALRHVKNFLQDLLPTSGDALYAALAEIKQGSGWAGLLGFAGLLYSASGIFSNLEIALNNVWGVREARVWWRQQLMALGTTALSLFLLLASLALSSAAAYLRRWDVPGTRRSLGDLPFVWQAVAFLTPILLSILLFAMLYKIVPNKRILWKEAFIGGTFAGLAFEAAKWGFGAYLARFEGYSRVYGSLGGLVILVVWAYYSSTILLLGAEIAADAGTKLPAADEEPVNVPPRQCEPKTVKAARRLVRARRKNRAEVENEAGG